MSTEDFSTTIAALERRLAEVDRKAAELRSLINLLCEEAGQPPKYADASHPGVSQSAGGVLTQIKRDSFYGKKQMTAIREYLEMRRAQGDGPATPQEIFDALKAGGYTIEAKSDEIAIVSVRALLRKATTVFHKIPGTRTYGLLVWYPGAKPTKQANGDEDDKGSRPKRRGPGKKRKASKPRKTKRAPQPETDTAPGSAKEAQAA